MWITIENRQTSPVRIAASHSKPVPFAGTIHQYPGKVVFSTLPKTNSSEDGWFGDLSLSFWGFDPFSRALAVSFSESIPSGKLKKLAGISPS